eukprot:TRINITY_DN8662_c0_g1_i5.p1 TRINITY_DN8662_c0_g1~~TRINITY_DN8662_c0_g1_i5.p1  ORF type:complete len:507 (-),score=111.59 TRINITY_DN8662_c0_g1_i5:30-1550(-)
MSSRCFVFSCSCLVIVVEHSLQQICCSLMADVVQIEAPKQGEDPHTNLQSLERADAASSQAQDSHTSAPPESPAVPIESKLPEPESSQSSFNVAAGSPSSASDIVPSRATHDNLPGPSPSVVGGQSLPSQDDGRSLDFVPVPVQEIARSGDDVSSNGVSSPSPSVVGGQSLPSQDDGISLDSVPVPVQEIAPSPSPNVVGSQSLPSQDDEKKSLTSSDSQFFDGTGPPSAGVDNSGSISGRWTFVEVVPEFNFLPKMMVLGSYGGGGAMQAARQILNLKCLQFSPTYPVDNDEVCRQILECLEKHNAIPKHKRVANLPDDVPGVDSFNRTVHFQISSHVYGEEFFNAMYQGYLFHDIPEQFQTHNRLGAALYPLIGVWNAHGIKFLDDAFPDVSNIPENLFKWAEQHVHLVQDFDNFWHFGPDMAKFCIDQEQAVVSGCFVMVDLEGMRIDYTYMLIVKPDLEDIVEKAFSKHPAPEHNPRQTLESINDHLKLSELELGLLKTLFG